MTRFGEQFSVRKENRLDVLRPNKEKPAYSSESLSVRKLLQESAKEAGGWPEMPKHIQSIEDCIEGAKKIVTNEWASKVSVYLDARCAMWADTLQASDDFAENKSKQDLERQLRNSTAIERQLSIHQFGSLEGLRQTLPEAWYELIMIAAERQMAALVLVRHWLKEQTPTEAKALAKKMGLQSPTELNLLLDSASLLGKYINQSYVKQMEMADAPGGSEETHLTAKNVRGSKRVYDIYTKEGSDEVAVKTYNEVFPFEWPRINQALLVLAKKVEVALEKKEVGEEYKQLPAYMRKMADTYSSTETDPEVLHQKWNELMADMRELAVAGCPIMLIPQGDASVAGSANKVDTEIRLGFITKDSHKLRETMQPFRQSVEKMIEAQAPYMDKTYPVPPVITNYQIAFGPNLYWTTRGEEGLEKLVAHLNAVVDVAVAYGYPAIQKMFTNTMKIEDFEAASQMDNTLHELGHVPLYKEDKKIKERLGSSKEVGVLEELKADTVNQKLAWEHVQAGNKENLDLEAQFMAKMGDICFYLTQKSSNPDFGSAKYYYAGVAMLERLFEKGIIKKAGEKYTVTNLQEGVHALADLGDESMRLYTHGSPKELKKYVQGFYDRAHTGEVGEFIARLKA